MYCRGLTGNGFHTFIELSASEVHEFSKLLYGEVFVGDVLAEDGLELEEELLVFLFCKDDVRYRAVCRFRRRVTVQATFYAFYEHFVAKGFYDVVGSSNTQAAQMVDIIVEGGEMDYG